MIFSSGDESDVIKIDLTWCVDTRLAEAAYELPYAEMLDSGLFGIFSELAKCLAKREGDDGTPLDISEGVTIKIRQRESTIEPLVEGAEEREVIRHRVTVLVFQDNSKDGRLPWMIDYEREYKRVNGRPAEIINRGSGWYRIYWGSPAGLSGAYRSSDIIAMTKRLEKRENYAGSK